MTTSTGSSLRKWVAGIIVFLGLLLVTGYITNEQFAALVDRLIPIGALAT